MILSFACVVLGFMFLIVGADKFVSGASALAKKLCVPSLIIGLTIVSFGTSSPELTVGLTAALSGASDITVGNVVGSNIFNILMVLGISSMVGVINVEKELLKRDLTAAIIGLVLVILFVVVDGTISRIDALILLLVFAFVIYKQISSALKNRSSQNEDEIESINSPIKIALLITLGLASVILGGQLAVYGATEIATKLGLSETLIGLTVVAVGTSLPELVTSVIATKKGETNIAIGNVVGANLFNVFLNLGVTSLICPIVTDPSVLFDLSFVLILSVLTYIIGKKFTFDKKVGFCYVMMYIGYTAYLIIR